MGLKNIKVDYETWRDLAKQKIEINLKKIADVIRDNNVIAKKFNNEAEFTEWFMKNYRSLGFDKIVEHRKNKFPDFIMIMDNKKVRVELETLSSHFVEHNHNPKKVDFVICLIRDKELPVRSIEVSMLEYIKGNVVTFRVERDLWLDFVHRLRKDKKKVWVVLSPFIKKYSMCDEQTRLLLVLFPKNLVDRLLEKEDPDRFIQEAIQERLASQE